MADQRILLRDPVERVGSLYEERREEFAELGWSLADLYLELGGGPRSSELHARFDEFFNGQAREVLAAGKNQAKLEFWAGIPQRGAALRDEAVAILARDHDLDVGGAATPRRRPDPETRSLILAHNQIDAELHAHFAAVAERERSRRAPRAPRPAQRSGAVCVLGAPRSGTSLTARILNILGVELGREGDLMAPAAENNRTGFWEHEGIVELNEEILATLSEVQPPHPQGWRWPPALAAGWQRDPSLEPHRRAAESLLRESFSNRSPWGWKDPRTSLTLPFWQQLVPEMRYVICVRHPLEVAASLAARDGMSGEESVDLWLRYMSAAVDQTERQPRIFVSYAGYFSGLDSQVERLAACLDLPAPTPAQLAAIADHIDERLRHHRLLDRDGSGEEAGLPAEALALYRRLTALVARG